MQKDVWFNGKWNNLSGSFAEFKTKYKTLTGSEYNREESDQGIFGGYYDGATYHGTTKGEEGPPTGSYWTD
tara:strand:- start:1348 stop:1560 length:213 start_codon:yes stop_codon:yes gene_type:complete